jgi:hypothetical protein
MCKNLKSEHGNKVKIVTFTALTPRNSHLPQVVTLQTQGTWAFWARAFISAIHVGVIGLWSPHDPSRVSDR